jgi:hypothetical protein
VILTIIYNDKKYEIHLDDDKTYTLAALIPYIKTILGISEELIITNSSNEILTPNCKIVEMILIDSSKYKNLNIKTFGSLSALTNTKQIREIQDSDLRREENSKNSNYNRTHYSSKTNNIKDNFDLYEQSNISGTNIRDRYLNEAEIYSDKNNINEKGEKGHHIKFDDNYSEYKLGGKNPSFTRNINYESDINKEYISDYSTMNFASPQNFPNDKKENYKQSHTERRIYRSENEIRKPFQEENIIKQESNTQDYLRSRDNYIYKKERTHSQDHSDYSFDEQKKSYTNSRRLRGHNY